MHSRRRWPHGLSWERGRPSSKVERRNGTRSRIAVPERRERLSMCTRAYVYMCMCIEHPVRGTHTRRESPTIVAVLEETRGPSSYDNHHSEISNVPDSIFVYRQFFNDRALKDEVSSEKWS